MVGGGAALPELEHTPAVNRGRARRIQAELGSEIHTHTRRSLIRVGAHLQRSERQRRRAETGGGGGGRRAGGEEANNKLVLILAHEYTHAGWMVTARTLRT